MPSNIVFILPVAGIFILYKTLGALWSLLFGHVGFLQEKHAASVYRIQFAIVCCHQHFRSQLGQELEFLLAAHLQPENAHGVRRYGEGTRLPLG